MNKKDSSINKIDYIEDNEIKRVAIKKNRYSDIYFIAIFLVLFGLLIGVFIVKKTLSNIKHVSIISNNLPVTIVNNGYINENISNSLFNKSHKYIIERIDSIEIKNQEKNNGKVLYNIRYEILDNSFPQNIFSSTDSNVLLRFSYSYDNKEWNYINNVISTSKSTINPLMGKYYDVSGIVDNLRVISNKELDSSKIYWKSETIFQDKNKIINNSFKANFKIEYIKSN